MSELQREVPHNRRQVLKSMACGFGFLSAAALADRQARGSVTNPLFPKTPHFAPRAKRMIFVFMQGGPSHVDTFDYKSRLAKHDGQMLTFDDARVLAKTKEIVQHRVFESPWKFKQHGDCGQPVSQLFPHIARHVDDLCFLKGMHTDGSRTARRPSSCTPGRSTWSALRSARGYFTASAAKTRTCPAS